MGYMGFGMRKIDYTRKPKKAFKKVKHIYGKELKIPKSNILLDENTHQKSLIQKEYRKSRTLSLVVSFLLCLAFSCTIIWFFILEEKYHIYKRNKFEQNEIGLYYKNELTYIQDILAFLNTRTDRISSLEYGKYNKRFSLRIKHPLVPDNYDREKVKFVSLRENFTNSVNKDRIMNSELRINREGYLPKAYKKDWVYLLDDVSKNQIPTSIAEFLNTKESEFENLLIKLRKLDRAVKVRKDLVCTSFRHPEFGHYYIIYTTGNPDRFKEVNGAKKFVSGKIKENLYWVQVDYSRK